MLLVHDLLLVGHQYAENTLDCTQQQFYWPGIKAQVQQYGASCPECQLTQAKGLKEVEMCPMPIVTTPFKRIGIDIVGPLTPAMSQNKYILLMVVYVTQYPEVVPLRNIRAKTVAGNWPCYSPGWGSPNR